MAKTSFLAIDLGATSGRAILATLDEGKLEMNEIHRFPNAAINIHGKFYWDIFSLYAEIKKGLKACGALGVKPVSIGIDTWGVDFGYVSEDGAVLGLPRAYRDPYTEGAPADFFANVMPSAELYSKVGIQVLNFNSIFQLYRQKQEGSGAQKIAAKALFIPDLLSYMLTGRMVCEYTIASTSALLNPVTKDIDRDLLEKACGNRDLFDKPVFPGTVIGTLSDELAIESGLGKIPVVAVAGHDTASAVAAVPAADEEFAYLSSGTWSLMGIEMNAPCLGAKAQEANFTNEGGVEGTTRFLKNITGMWIIEQVRKQWKNQGKTYSYPEMVDMALASTYDCFINPDDPCFANPADMLGTIEDYLVSRGYPAPASDSDIIRLVYRSLSNRYKEVLADLQAIAPFKITKLHVIGGGSVNPFMNQCTADMLGIPVVCGPTEATAIGNIMIQAQGVGLVKNRWDYRKLIAEAIDLKVYNPGDPYQRQTN